MYRAVVDDRSPYVREKLLAAFALRPWWSLVDRQELHKSGKIQLQVRYMGCEGRKG